MKTTITLLLLLLTLIVSAQDLTVYEEKTGDRSKYGFKDKSGKVVVAATYDEVLEFSEGLAAVSLDELWGYIDPKGELVIPMELERAFSFEKGFAEVEHRGAVYMMDKDGYFFSKDFVESFHAAKAGDVDAMVDLGVRYYTSDGVLKDYQASYDWNKKAADLGDLRAMTNIATMYFFGAGPIQKDWVKAFEWYKKAADLGHPKALHAVGSSYYRGEGVEKDLVKAREWFQKAADKGYEKAIKAIAEMNARGE